MLLVRALWTLHLWLSFGSVARLYASPANSPHLDPWPSVLCKEASLPPSSCLMADSLMWLRCTPNGVPPRPAHQTSPKPFKGPPSLRATMQPPPAQPGLLSAARKNASALKQRLAVGASARSAPGRQHKGVGQLAEQLSQDGVQLLQLLRQLLAVKLEGVPSHLNSLQQVSATSHTQQGSCPGSVGLHAHALSRARACCTRRCRLTCARPGRADAGAAAAQHG